MLKEQLEKPLVRVESEKVGMDDRTSAEDSKIASTRWQSKAALHQISGFYVYAVAAIFLGLLGLVSGDFATTWQNVGPNVPCRSLIHRLHRARRWARPTPAQNCSRPRHDAHRCLLRFHTLVGAQGPCKSRQLRPHRERL